MTKDRVNIFIGAALSVIACLMGYASVLLLDLKTYAATSNVRLASVEADMASIKLSAATFVTRQELRDARADEANLLKILKDDEQRIKP